MQTIVLDQIKTEKVSSGIFTGTVGLRKITGTGVLTDSKYVSITIVTFPKGVRNIFHTHDGDQVLWILSGEGIVASESEEVSAVPGMAFFIPAGERHWHGATVGSDFSHISILGHAKMQGCSSQPFTTSSLWNLQAITSQQDR
jgi:quercetin dioxygenase-like cupin family protein